MTEVKAEQEMDDYTGQYKLNMVWEDLSKDFLIRLMLIWQKAIKDFHMYWISAIWERTGDFKVAAECAREVWFKHGDTITPLCAEACKIDVKTVHDVHKAIMMMPDAGTKSRNHPNLTQSIDMHQTSEHENHHRAWCDSCMWLTTMEELGQEEHIEFLCSVLCQPVYANYVRSLLPGVKVTALKTPPRKSKGEVPVCEWEAVLEK